MNRRELLKAVAALSGYAVMGGEAFLQQAQAASSLRLTSRQIHLLDEIAETIIPATDTPGAKAAQVGKLMDVMVRDCYTPVQQAAFMQGLATFPQQCKATMGSEFLGLTQKQRHTYLVQLEKEAKEFNREQGERDAQRKSQAESENKDNSYQTQKEFEALPLHFYTMIKQLTLLGFFTSETGMTKTLRYVAIPGRYDGDVPYKKGERAWA
ncbi:MAG: gluconate 2-dehydrogenase subunit 3 family protein [Burkholderiales bacterium]|nr:gluconate 2-dehydrogenase subunit 3 family protein [Burkholderiales bacterium]